jgi:hypothetical protein
MSTTKDFQEYEAKCAAMATLAAEILPLNKTALFDALDPVGICSVIVSFNGVADSGQIESIVGFKEDNTETEVPATSINFRQVLFDGPSIVITPRTVGDTIEIMTYDLLESTHEGWETGDGAEGKFTFDAVNRTITLDYYERYTATDYSQHEF